MTTIKQRVACYRIIGCLTFFFALAVFFSASVVSAQYDTGEHTIATNQQDLVTVSGDATVTNKSKISDIRVESKDAKFTNEGSIGAPDPGGYTGGMALSDGYVENYGTITRLDMAGGKLVNANPESLKIDYKDGKFVLENRLAEGKKVSEVTITGGEFINYDNTKNVTVNGGVFTNDYYYYNDNNGLFAITGGGVDETLTLNAGGKVINKHRVTNLVMYGGDFEHLVNDRTALDALDANGNTRYIKDAKIYGGKFYGDGNVQNMTLGTYSDGSTTTEGGKIFTYGTDAFTGHIDKLTLNAGGLVEFVVTDLDDYSKLRVDDIFFNGLDVVYVHFGDLFQTNNWKSFNLMDLFEFQNDELGYYFEGALDWEDAFQIAGLENINYRFEGSIIYSHVDSGGEDNGDDPVGLPEPATFVILGLASLVSAPLYRRKRLSNR